MEDLQLLVRDARDEADDVPFGAECENVGEEAERHHARADGEGRRADVPASETRDQLTTSTRQEGRKATHHLER